MKVIAPAAVLGPQELEIELATWASPQRLPTWVYLLSSIAVPLPPLHLDALVVALGRLRLCLLVVDAADGFHANASSGLSLIHFHSYAHARSYSRPEDCEENKLDRRGFRLVLANFPDPVDSLIELFLYTK